MSDVVFRHLFLISSDILGDGDAKCELGRLLREVRAGWPFPKRQQGSLAKLRFLEGLELSLAELRLAIARKISEAFDDPRPAIPAHDIFDQIERPYAG